MADVDLRPLGSAIWNSCLRADYLAKAEFLMNGRSEFVPLTPLSFNHRKTYKYVSYKGFDFYGATKSRIFTALADECNVEKP